MLKNIKQFFYPNEFRIETPLWPDNMHKTLLDISKAMEVNQSENSVNDQDTMKILVDAGTGIWRLGTKLESYNSRNESGEMKSIIRRYKATMNILNRQGLEIKDYNGEEFNSGMAMDVLVFQPDPNIKRDIITETVKPTIYYKDKLISRGEVVVNTPEKEETKKEEKELVKNEV